MDSTPVHKVKLWDYTIWFKDSGIIYEQRTHFKSEETTSEGTIVKMSFPVYKYSYLDLKSMNSQDYLKFSDTSNPLNNYSIKYLKPNEGILLWQFYRPKSLKDTIGIKSMPDTIIDGKKYKRIKTLQIAPNNEVFHTINYLVGDAPVNIFHLNPTLDEMYGNCKTMRTELFDSLNHIVKIFEYRIMEDKLTEKEEGVFKQWENNSLNTKLPLLPLSEAEKLNIPIQHENPTIKIIPLQGHSSGNR